MASPPLPGTLLRALFALCSQDKKSLRVKRTVKSAQLSFEVRAVIKWFFGAIGMFHMKGGNPKELEHILSLGVSIYHYYIYIYPY